MLLHLPLLAAFLSPAAAWVVPTYLAVGASKSTNFDTQTNTGGIWSTSTYTTVGKYVYTRTVSERLSITTPPFRAIPTRTVTSISGLVTFKIIHLPLSQLPYPLPTPVITYPWDDNQRPTIRYWIEPRTYTAAETCPRQWTYVTSTTVHPPTAITYQLEPTSTSAEFSTFSGTTTALYWLYLTSGAVSATSTDFKDERYATDCSEPFHAAAETEPGVTWDPGPRRKLAPWVIVLVTVLPTLFLAGFVESYLWFRRLMRGRSALRLGTICWVCIGLWAVLLCKREKAVGVMERRVLEKRWGEMRGGDRWRLWWRWGFRWKYPAELLGERSGVGVGVLSPQQVGTGGGGEAKGAMVVEEESSSGGLEERDVVVRTAPAQVETQEPEHRPSAATPYLGSLQRWDAQQRTSGNDGYLGSLQRWK